MSAVYQVLQCVRKSWNGGASHSGFGVQFYGCILSQIMFHSWWVFVFFFLANDSPELRDQQRFHVKPCYVFTVEDISYILVEKPFHCRSILGTKEILSFLSWRLSSQTKQVRLNQLNPPKRQCSKFFLKPLYVFCSSAINSRQRTNISYPLLPGRKRKSNELTKCLC